MHAPPGSFWNYSNPNFMLAGLVAERASGVPYRDLLKQQLWEPAGMHATTFTPAEVIEGGDYSYGHATHPVTNTPLYISPTDNDLWVPERRFAVAVLANVMYSLTLAAYCIVDEVLDPPPVDPPDLSTDPSTWGRYVGDYSITQYDGQTADATVFLDGQSLMFSIEDPNEPGTVVTSELEQYYLDTFLFDSDGDGVVDNDATFCDRTGEPGFMMWFRNRMAVGERQLTPRRGGRQVSP